MAFHTIAAVGELSSGEIKVVQLNGKEILLLNVEGVHYAVSNICSHAEARVSDGWLEGAIIECPLHGSRFDVRTGEVLSFPAEQPLPRYEVRVEGVDIQVAID